MKMTEEAKERLRNTPRAKCSVCNSSRQYENPIAVCIKCKNKFCYDHITAVVEEKGVVDYCDKCLQ